jgi:soluble lytic murein transglycosylase-like protein
MSLDTGLPRKRLTLQDLFARLPIARAVRGLALALLGLGLAAPARAQIYSWRDANGNLVLSNHAREGGVSRAIPSYPVPRAEKIRATRFAATERGRLYDDLIAEHAQANGVRPDLVKAVVQVESAFNPRAKSPKGAMGLMQLMPAVAQQFGVSDPFDPSQNVKAGVAYLRLLLDRYQDNEELALAAYNAGPGAVDKHGQTVPPYSETRNYVAQINELSNVSTPAPSHPIYRTMEIIDGQPVARYSDRKPASGAYEILGRHK